jgi:hypothetical protein
VSAKLRIIAEGRFCEEFAGLHFAINLSCRESRSRCADDCCFGA